LDKLFSEIEVLVSL